MSFAKRLRAQRSTTALTLAAALASLALGAASLPAQSAAESVSTRQAPSTREFADTHTQKRRASKTVTNRAKGGRGKAKGYDSRKGRRRVLMEILGVKNTGRQWRKMRQAIRHSSAPYLLTTPAWQLRLLQR